MTHSDVRILHFDLSQLLRRSTRAMPGPLSFHAGSSSFTLQPHTPATRAAARRNNAALSLLPAVQEACISHFVEVPEDVFSTERLTHLRVTTPSEDPAIYLPELLWVSFHLPKAYRLRHLQNRLAKSGDAGVPSTLAAYGVDVLPHGDAELIWRDLGDFATPLDVAKTLVFHCPELASYDPFTATIVMEDHIASNANSLALNQLATEISAQGQNGWNRTTASTDSTGKPMTFGFDLGDRKAGEQVLIYQLTERTIAALRSPIANALRSASDDPRLQGRSWSVQPGVTAFNQPEGRAARVRSQRGGLQWTLEDVTPNSGLSSYTGSLQFNGGVLSLDVKNHFLRTLSTYVQFFDTAGNAIRNPVGWTSASPDDELRPHSSDSKKYLDIISPVDAIMGIPLAGRATGLSIRFPDAAASVRLLFGGLGTSRWDADVDTIGVILTAVFNYAVPTLCLIAGAMVSDTKWFHDLLLDVGIQVAAIAASKIALGGSLLDLLRNPVDLLLLFASSIGGILVANGMEKLAEKLAIRIAAAALINGIPVVGWVNVAASIGVTTLLLGVTTAQILSSPATLELHVKRTMDLRVVLTPDPNHGEAGKPETAVWPALSARYQITVQYLGGTYFVKEGAMPRTTASTPIDVTFEGLPAGGELRVIAGIHSANGWLCGGWQSETVQALPPGNGSTLKVGGAIEESLVPLTRDTQYIYKEKIAHDASQGHVWRTGGLPTATQANLSASNIGMNLSKLVCLTINQPAFQIGYAWRASGQNLPLLGAGTTPESGQVYAFQNLSVLAVPESRMKFVNRGMLEQPVVAYDMFTKLPASGGAAISQRNFYVDARYGRYHLRQIVLSDGSRTIDLTANKGSWGRFPLEHLDDLVIHPSGYAIGLNTVQSKLMLIQLPEAAQPDDQAPVAHVLSGVGSRMGLLNAPCALSVTPDGRILVLEKYNRRIQAFDTAGNPVPCFDGNQLAIFPAASLLAALDAGVFSDALQAQFQANKLSHRCDLALAWQETLNRAVMTDALREAFQAEGVLLTHSPERPNDPSVNARVEVKTAGASWRVIDAGQSRAYAITRGSNALAVFDELRDVTIDVREVGKRWIITDHTSSRAYHLQAINQTQIRVLSYQPFMNLQGSANTTYLDVAVESMGYIYVLSHVDKGHAPQDYMLDVYEPNGAHLTRVAPNGRGEPMCAARIVVDLWRNLYALNYETFAGPGGRTEPTVSHWTPTAPGGTTRMLGPGRT